MNHVVKPIQMLRSDWLTEGHHTWIGCLPKTTCKTCRQDTKGYSSGMCEDCAKSWTNAFYQLAEEHLGIRVQRQDNRSVKE